MQKLFLAVLLSVLGLVLSVPAQTHAQIYPNYDPYYPNLRTPKLITPQWVGEEGVEAVVVLAIDDMRGHEKWENYLRPILQRLRKIDGRSPVSIMTCEINPQHPHLQRWLKEGVSLETHTIDHPCPLLRDGNLERAKSTYDRCVDLLASVPGNKPVAFRTPCCDSLNTVSPRFYAEIFTKKTAKGHFLSIDSSVFNVFTADDPQLPRELVLENDGTQRFAKYLPAERSFVNTIENYPYPYVIGHSIWQFPCVTPSDWQGQHVHGPNHPNTLRDMKAALDATVIKQGVYCLVFHPHGWMTNEQIVELIDHATQKHGKKIKFLNFAECLARINQNLLDGAPLRHLPPGWHNKDLMDCDGDGFYDILGFRDKYQRQRRWIPKARRWTEWFNGDVSRATSFKGRGYQQIRLAGIESSWLTSDRKPEVLIYSSKEAEPQVARFGLPEGAKASTYEHDSGLRFVDVDEDGNDDVVFSNEKVYGLYLFENLEKGWSRKILAGKAGQVGALPPISIAGKNNGFFVHSRSLCWQNEHTSSMKNLVDRRSFNELLANETPFAKSPEASLRCIQVRPGFRVELMAAEPLVRDPISLAWGPDGKCWVVEMGDYPTGRDGKGKSGGRVRFLEDTNGDGRYDRSTLFLDELPFPTSVLPWRTGVLITAAPDILFAEDTNGDGKADRVQKLYTGFTPGNPQHRVNSLVWGLDNWIHVANGDSGGTIKSVKTGKVVTLRGRDLRIHPDTGDLDSLSGQTQYGRNRDDWGNWFGGNNSEPMWHYVFEDRYLRRNPFLPHPSARVNVPTQAGAAPVYPRSHTGPRFNDHHTANRFTSACSPMIYRDELFGPAFQGNSFVCEPVHNLVHRERVTPQGVTFTSRRASDEKQTEFLASSDNWFRPTTVITGPDGALWVADMYRFVIEHPEWIPLEWQKKLDLRAGQDLGRIYRVSPVDRNPRAMPRLDKLALPELVQALDSPNGWQRDTVQQMLLWQKDKAAIPLLRYMLKNPRPLTRVQALCTLAGLQALDADVLRSALTDDHFGVRTQAIRLCEETVSLHATLFPALAECVRDDHAQVQLQLAYTLGEIDDPRVGDVLGSLALRVQDDPYRLTAVFSSISKKNLDAVLLRVLKAQDASGNSALLERLLSLATLLGHRQATFTLLDAVSQPAKAGYQHWQFAAIGTLLDSLHARGIALREVLGTTDESKQLWRRVQRMAESAGKIALDARQPSSLRLATVPLLTLIDDGSPMQAAERLLQPQEAEDIRLAAVTMLARHSSAEVPRILLVGWGGYGPALRSQVLETLLRRPNGVKVVLDALENRQIRAFEIDAARRQRLLEQKDPTIRARADRLLAGAISPDREKVLATYQSVSKQTPNPTHGAQLFVKHCAVCHKLNGQGKEVGPDLSALGDKSTEALLVALFDPNRAVEARYVSYLAETKAGLTYSGVLTSESGNSITLVGTDGKEQTILRTNLESLTSSGKSTMPEGFEKELNPQDVADLLAHLRSAKASLPRKTFPSNKPALVLADSKGALKLTPATAEIYGPTLVLERQYGNLGYWSSAEDQAVWEIDVPRRGRYEVWLDWALDPSGGGTLRISADQDGLSWQVVTTANWDTYQRKRVGMLQLEKGRQRLSLRAEGAIRGALIDVRQLDLVPEK